ncbi:MAG: 50S ribosomal protein L5 [Euryarchaeota archaeon]|jgi:large subunit ribosomal protein L5|nr:50S ribosomal protein L5 [Euryarchaeota archaeon]HIK01398.1 50S ribosomal protein L5 [Candidatus Undinarchaeales archaeon ERR594346 U_76725]|tara:strand:+ start:29590 stop:30099 length:510 start_codon:yes stop_codon:yes gene_type:complete
MIKISKVSVNIGAGGEKDKLNKAEILLSRMFTAKPVRTVAKAAIPEFNVKKNGQVGVKLTLRGEDANTFLNQAFEAVENELKPTQIDREGNLSFGVVEYMDLPHMKYDPDVGMFGMNVSVHLVKPGARIAQRKIKKTRLPKKNRVSYDESRQFFEKNYTIKFVEPEEYD